jgi:small-conductance mechanosensitive channel
METLRRWIIDLKTYDVHLFNLGDTAITLWGLVWTLALIVLLFFFADMLRQWLVKRVLIHSKLDPGTREAVGSIARYLLLVTGVLIIMQTAGINLTTFNVLAGAVGVGVGFGLQNIVSNFISGLIIMFERPVKVGDRIEVAGVEGEVLEIGIRRTTVMANNGVAVIIPNSKFITENVRNWEYRHTQNPISIAVNAAATVSPREVEGVLLEVVERHAAVSKAPAPRIHLKNLTGNALAFELTLWSTLEPGQRAILINELNIAIYEAFVSRNIKLA